MTGIIQFLLGIFKVGRFITFVPHSVLTGFVNALAILIFMAQLTHFTGANWIMYAMVAGTLAIVYILPRFFKGIPAPLIAIVVMTIITLVFHLDVRTVGDMGNITSTLPMFHLPNIAWTWDTLMILLPYSFTMALVGLLESLLTATIVDEMTETKSSKNREVRGQGIANFVNGLFGGMGGCAMIGQSVINVKSGGRGRLSTFTAGAFLAILLLLFSGVVKQVPMGALVGVMFMVCIGTFDWSSIKNIARVPRGSLCHDRDGGDCGLYSRSVDRGHGRRCAQCAAFWLETDQDPCTGEPGARAEGISGSRTILLWLFVTIRG